MNPLNLINLFSKPEPALLAQFRKELQCAVPLKGLPVVLRVFVGY